MSKLYFKFGAMASSKTANALMTRFNYEEKGKSVWLIKPAKDTRDNDVDENGKIRALVKSRIGLYAQAEAVSPSVNLRERVEKEPVDVIICDECQFLTEEQVEQMKDIVDEIKRIDKEEKNK